jgi:hypothetical protein
MQCLGLGLLAVFAFAMTTEAGSRIATIEVKGMA